MKTACIAEQQERKQWVKRQQIVHSYGSQEDQLGTQEEGMVNSDSSIHSHIGGVRSVDDGGKEILLLTGHHTQESGGEMSTAQPTVKGKERKPCKSRTHSCVSFHACPLNQKS